MPRDVDAAADPHAVVLEHIIEESCQPLGTAGASGEPVVQRQRHHLRLALAFAVEHVERILHEGEEVGRRREGQVAVEPIVVRLVGIRDDQVLAAHDLHPVRQFVAGNTALKAEPELKLSSAEQLEQHALPFTKTDARAMAAEKRAEAKAKGYEGEACGECGTLRWCATARV